MRRQAAAASPSTRPYHSPACSAPFIAFRSERDPRTKAATARAAAPAPVRIVPGRRLIVAAEQPDVVGPPGAGHSVAPAPVAWWVGSPPRAAPAAPQPAPPLPVLH